MYFAFSKKNTSLEYFGDNMLVIEKPNIYNITLVQKNVYWMAKSDHVELTYIPLDN